MQFWRKCFKSKIIFIKLSAKIHILGGSNLNVSKFSDLDLPNGLDFICSLICVGLILKETDRAWYCYHMLYTGIKIPIGDSSSSSLWLKLTSLFLILHLPYIWYQVTCSRFFHLKPYLLLLTQIGKLEWKWKDKIIK